MKPSGKIAKILVVAGSLAFLAGCAGGGADSETNVRTSTQGQELLDLKAALDAGAISADEYEDQRQKILDRE